MSDLTPAMRGTLARLQHGAALDRSRHHPDLEVWRAGDGHTVGRKTLHALHLRRLVVVNGRAGRAHITARGRQLLDAALTSHPCPPIPDADPHP